ncbi:hypothetical protein OB08_04115 [Microbacterium sp. HJ5]
MGVIEFELTRIVSASIEAVFARLVGDVEVRQAHDRGLAVVQARRACGVFRRLEFPLMTEAATRSVCVASNP